MAACRMTEIFHHHVPVLLKEAIAPLLVSKDGIYIDATYGRGSHAQAILNELSPAGHLIAFDKDAEAVAHACLRHEQESRFQIFHRSFSQIESTLNDLNWHGKVDGVLFDLGVSSPQLDNPNRGFSFSQEGPLDMRMDTSRGQTAAQWLANVAEKDLADVLWRYGEEKLSRRIAHAIVTQRETTPLTTTKQLADLIKAAMPYKGYQEKHPATRSFQAIRIYLNQELSDLELALEQAFNVLKPGGRLAVISFHSLEDRIVKQFIHHYEKGASLPRKLPIKGITFAARLKSVGKPIKPSEQEVNINPRARSAILRIAEKQS